MHFVLRSETISICKTEIIFRHRQERAYGWHLWNPEPSILAFEKKDMTLKGRCVNDFNGCYSRDTTGFV